jgi:hypothetical protein
MAIRRWSPPTSYNLMVGYANNVKHGELQIQTELGLSWDPSSLRLTGSRVKVDTLYIAESPIELTIELNRLAKPIYSWMPHSVLHIPSQHWNNQTLVILSCSVLSIISQRGCWNFRDYIPRYIYLHRYLGMYVGPWGVGFTLSFIKSSGGWVPGTSIITSLCWIVVRWFQGWHWQKADMIGQGIFHGLPT